MASKRSSGEGTRWKDDRGYYCWELSIGQRGNRKRIIVKAKTARERDERIKEKLKELEARGIDGAKAAALNTVQEQMTQWLEFRIKPNRAHNTYRSYEQVCRLYIFPAIGKVKVNRLTSLDLQRIAATVQATGKSDRTVRYAVTLVGNALGSRVTPLLEEVELPAAPDPRGRVLTEEEIDAVLTKANEYIEKKTEPGTFYHPYRSRHLLTFLLNSGVRISECLGLQIFDVDMTDSAVEVTKQLEWTGKKGRKGKASSEADGRRWRLKPKLKGKNNRRRVPITPEGLQAVKDQIRMIAADREAAGDGYEDNGLLFPTESGSPQFPRTVSRSLEAVIKSAGVEHATLHDLRRTYGTILAKNGADPHIIAAIFGHASVTVTNQYYIWAHEDSKKAAVATLDIRGRVKKPTEEAAEQTGSA